MYLRVTTKDQSKLYFEKITYYDASIENTHKVT